MAKQTIVIESPMELSFQCGTVVIMESSILAVLSERYGSIMSKNMSRMKSEQFPNNSRRIPEGS